MLECPGRSVRVLPTFPDGCESFRQVTSCSGLDLPIGPANCWLNPDLWGHFTQTLETPDPGLNPLSDSRPRHLPASPLRQHLHYRAELFK